MYIHRHICVQQKIMKIWGHESEKEKERVHGRVWTEEREKENDGIIL